MAHIKRLVFLVFVLFSFSAFSQGSLLGAPDKVPAEIYYQATWTEPGCAYCMSSTLAGVCAQGMWSNGYSVVSGGCKSGATGIVWAVNGPLYKCSDGNVPDASHMCIKCPEGQVYSKNSLKCLKPCEGLQTRPENSDDCICDAARFNRLAYEDTYIEGSSAGGVPSQACSSSCIFETGTGLAGKGWWAAVRGKMTGATCGGTSTPAKETNKPLPKSKPPLCAPTDGVMTSSSGTVACVPEGTLNSSKPDVKTKTRTETFADGSTKKVTETTTRDPNSGATDTQTTTTSSGGISGSAGTTTTKSTDSGGGGGGGGGGGDGTGDFCEKNPESVICKNHTWTGDCDASPACEGDAVACATAKAVWELRCVNKWAEKDNQLSAAVNQDSLLGDDQKMADALNKDGKKDWDLMAKFQENKKSYVNFTGSCSFDLGFDFKGQRYTFDTTVLCQIGSIVRILLMITAWLILVRVFSQKFV